MNGWSDPALVAAARLAGALAGAAISLAYLLPKGRREAALRFTVGLVSGLAFGGLAGLKLGQVLGVTEVLGPAETALAGATLASFAAWWLLGALLRAIRAWPRR